MKNSIAHMKAKAFAVRVVKFVKYLENEKHEYTLSKQMLRSGTSIGANLHECINAQSKADFISKLHIALKEANETEYWLELLCETDSITKTDFDDFQRKCVELRRMLVSSVTTLKKK